MKTFNGYRCDFCRKAYKSVLAIKAHEKFCFNMLERDCRNCVWRGENLGSHEIPCLIDDLSGILKNRKPNYISNCLNWKDEGPLLELIEMGDRTFINKLKENINNIQDDHQEIYYDILLRIDELDELNRLKELNEKGLNAQKKSMQI